MRKTKKKDITMLTIIIGKVFTLYDRE